MTVDDEVIGEVAIGDDEVHDQTDDEVVDDDEVDEVDEVGNILKRL